MRSALSKIEGISNIKTDPKASPPLCTFHIANANFDIEAKLNELSDSNAHIKGWSLAN